MLYPDTISEKLGFDTIKSWLREKCTSDLGRALVDKIGFQVSSEKISQLNGQTYESIRLLESGNLIVPEQIDSFYHLERIKVEGSYLEAEHIVAIGNSLRTTLDSVSSIKSFEHFQLTYLTPLVDLVNFDEGLPAFILRVFDDQNNIKDGASSELKNIRKSIKSAQSSRDRALNSILKEAKKNGFVPEKMGTTIRDGRLVIPILAEHKRKLAGLVHDESATGQTVYIEPSEALEANNRIVELEYAERREIIKILTELADMIRVNMMEIGRAYKFMSILDFLQAKAQLATEKDYRIPEQTKESKLLLKGARNPILEHSLVQARSKSAIIPLDLVLNKTERILLISGPNAGGKSVALKTVGLIQYMFQSGIPVPVDEGSKLGVYADIFVDIGDDQSLENDLSTYSSHLKNMDIMIQNARSNSLILIDEFGTGTDPQFGGAIAQAVLSKLTDLNCQGLITTHYGNLKDFADTTKGVFNGAMRFDLKRLKPLYVLEVGKPGSSYALEVAQNIGLDKEVISRARDLVGTDQVELESMLSSLTEEKYELSKKLEKLNQDQKVLKAEIEKYQDLKDDLDAKRKEILDRSSSEADQLLKKANAEIEKTIRHIKENKANKIETKRIRNNLENFKEQLRSSSPKSKKVKPVEPIVSGPIQVGDIVKLKDGNMAGEVVELKGKSATLTLGGLTTKAELKNLQKVGKVQNSSKNSNNKKPVAKSHLNLARKQALFQNELDLRGKRAEEIAGILDTYLDDAILLGQSQLRIIHGRGNGVLREVVRGHLKDYTAVTKIQSEHADRGGDGVSIISLK